MTAQELQWIEFTDFSPGIFSNNKLAGGVQITSTNPAMAQEANTYRCIALPNGGLGPLPRRKASYGLTTIPESGNGYTYTVAGLGTWGRILPSATTAGVEGLEAHVALYYQVPNGANWDLKLSWLRERLFDVPRGTETIRAVTVVASTATNEPRFAYFLKTRMNPTSPLVPGLPVMVGILSLADGNLIIINRAWPDPATPTTTSTIIVGDQTEASAYELAVAHQGRVILAAWGAHGHGATANLVSNDNLLWTDVNDNTLSSATAAVFVPETDQIITDLISMSANQLLVVKAFGGGYMVSGDIDDPTITRLPNLMSPHGVEVARGVNTSLGCVYSAGRAGLRLWNGGDGSEDISHQLDGEFHMETDWLAGKMDNFLDLVFVPGNWVWNASGDTNKRGWWRIENPTDLAIKFWSATSNDRIVGARKSFTDASPNFMYVYMRDDLAYTWSWQSHPLWVSRDRVLQTREAVVALQGHGTVTITLINEAGTTDAHVITIDTDVIRNYRFNVSLKAQNLQVRLAASGNNGGGAGTYEAPTLHRLFIGYQTEHQLPLTDV